MGGSFDPPHHGHLILAQDAAEALSLGSVVFVPAAAAPLKKHPPVAAAPERLEMVRAAIAGHHGWEASDWEIRQGGTSHSLHTARHWRERHPDADIFWIIGADQLAQLPAWHRIGELAQHVRFALAARTADTPDPPPTLPPQVRIVPLPPRRMDISSTEIRERIRKNLPVDFFLPEPVHRHIERRQLYR
jgi:nicotinate-nucleotide adenylyltransferase